MPNHVHVLFKTGSTPMAKTVESWKKYTAQRANQILGRRGAFWQRDYWDTYMRDERQTAKAKSYIEANPSKAGLVLDPATWPWSSARLRDDSGTLRI
jgi:REP element-mobilizing transposase RayT